MKRLRIFAATVHSAPRVAPVRGMGFCSVVVLFACLWAADATASVRTLLLAPGQGRFELSPYLEILEDKNGQYTIDEISSTALLHEFKPLHGRTLNLGLTSSVIWIRFSITISNQAGGRHL